MAISGIYIIKCLTNNMVYVGQSNNCIKRFNTHRSLLRNNKHHNRYLQNTFNNLDESYFKFEIIKETYDNLNILEEYYFNKYRENSFNISKDFTCPVRGLKRSKEWCNNISKSHIGLKHSPSSKLLISKNRKGVSVGSNHFRVKPIYQYNLQLDLINIWYNGASNLAKELNLSRRSIAACLSNQNKTGLGYIWSYTKLKN